MSFKLPLTIMKAQLPIRPSHIVAHMPTAVLAIVLTLVLIPSFSLVPCPILRNQPKKGAAKKHHRRTDPNAN
jgi:hypothetical protein